MDSFLLFSAFPEDVQRVIFEHAFEIVPNAARLALVSRQVNTWIEPLIYRTTVISKIPDDVARILMDPTTSHKPKDFYKNHIKSLFVDELPVVQFVEALLHTCDNLISLAWWTIAHDRKKWASFLLTKPYPSMRKLSIYSGLFPSDTKHPFNAPIFRTLTHLDIGLPPSHFPKPGLVSDPVYGNLRKLSWEGLQSLDCLVHLHLDLKLAVSFQDPTTDGEDFRSNILDMLPYLPPNLKYFAILLPFTFLSKASTLTSERRQFYYDLIWGRVDSRIVVGYPSRRWNIQTQKMTHANVSADDFGRYLLPRARENKLLRVVLPRPEEDFWDEAETMVHRRNQELLKVQADASL